MEKTVVAYFYILSLIYPLLYSIPNLPEGPNKTTHDLRVTGLWIQL